MDADGSDDLDGAALVARAVIDGDADLAMGSRTRGSVERGALTPQQRVGNALASIILRMAYGLRVSDLGPTRAIRRATLLRLEMRELGYGWSTEMLAKAARAGLRVREIPVDYHRRAGGRSKVAGTVRGTVRAGVHILRTLARCMRWQPGEGKSFLPDPLPAHGEREPAWHPLVTAEVRKPVRRGEAHGEDVGPGSVLAIVAKLPVAGRVKTRLGTVLGYAAATELYGAFLRDLGARFAAAAARDAYDLCWLYTVPEGATTQDFVRYVPPGALLLPQEGADFAERLWNGTEALAARGYARVVIVSSDSPHLPAARIRQAFDALATTQVVLGPATDGGYYLLGQQTAPAPVDLFTGIQMSTASVCSETLARASALGLDVTLLQGTFDVDEAPDLEQLRAALADAPSPAADQCPATVAALRALDISPSVKSATSTRVGGER